MMRRTYNTPSDPLTIELVPAWDGNCNTCRGSIGLDEEHWLWSLPTGGVYMHISCARSIASWISTDLARLDEDHGRDTIADG